MADTSQLPTWAVYAVAFGTPSSALVGVLVTGLLDRRSTDEIERRSRREEVMRLMRWASELAMDPGKRRARLGVDQLWALADSELLGNAEKALVDVALESALGEVVRAIEDNEYRGDEVRIRRRPDTAATASRVDESPTVEHDDG